MKPFSGVNQLDKLEGMFLLSAYGDALGVANEGQTPPLIPIERLPKVRDLHISEDGPWGIWIPPSYLGEDSVGIVSDDTAYKIFILAPYVEHLLAEKKDPGDREFVTLLRKIVSRSLTTVDHLPTLREAQENMHKHAADWVAMYRAADNYLRFGNCHGDDSAGDAAINGGTNCFFEAGKAVCFGLFLFLPLACAYGSMSTSEIYRIFRNLTFLDQSHAGVATGISAVLLARAFSQTPGDQDHFVPWFQGNLAAIFDEVREIEDDEGKILVDRIRSTIEVLADCVRIRKESPLGLINRTIYETRKDRLPEGVGSLLFDPAEFLGVISAGLEWSSGNPFFSFPFVANSGGDTDTIGSLLGLFVGAYFGAEKVRLIAPGDLLQDLQQIEMTFNRLFGTSLYVACHTFDAFIRQNIPLLHQAT